ncbi:MAG: T9SS type A sorting domain-containing protein [Saprospiraceae bacterium]|nr:T9SS type A sorting domain-containing protein [Saprospiraceae bacterium]
MRTAILIGWLLWQLPILAVSQIPFFSEDFSTPGFPAGWTSTDDSGNPVNLSLFWEKCEAGAYCPPRTYTYFGNQPFNSTTGQNGYLFADSEDLNLPGALDPHLSRLTSPPINCSGQEEVILQFETHIGVYNYNAAENAIIRVSANGSNWTEYTLFPDLGTPTNTTIYNTNPGIIWVDISATAAFQSTVFIQWQWLGEDEWGWAIDDVKLFSKHPIYDKAVWGTGPGEGLFENGLNGWTSNLLMGTDSEWEWTPNGWFGNAYSAAEGLYLSSPSYYNGAASYNADYYTTGDTLPVPPPYPFYSCELISPNIDLSNINKLVNLRFAQSVRLLNKRPGFPFQTAFAYSVDGGNSWSNWVNANSGEPINGLWKPEISNFPLPPEVLGQDDFRVKFLFAGDFFGWIIDDVLIVEREDNDLAAQENFYAVNASLQTPLSALSPVYFLLDIRNEGQFAQENSEALVEIFKESGEMVFKDSIALGVIEPDELVENILFDNVFIPNEIGSYTGRYYVRSNAFDTKPENDSLYWHFMITDSIFAKELGFTGAFTPTETYDYSYGNCFYIPPGATQKACKVTFGVDNIGQLLGQKVNIITYELPEGDADGDLEITPSEYQQVAFNEYTFTGLEDDYITIPIEYQGGTIALNPDTYYAVLLRYASNNNKRCYINASQEYDLQATYVLYDQLENPRYFSMLDLDNTGTFSIIGLGDSGFDQIPIVRLHLCNNTSSATELATDFPILVYPNPVSNLLFIETEFEKISKIELVDLQGRQQKEILDFSSADKQVEVNISNLSTGMYILFVYDKAGRIHHRKIVRSQAK